MNLIKKTSIFFMVIIPLFFLIRFFLSPQTNEALSKTIFIQKIDTPTSSLHFSPKKALQDKKNTLKTNTYKQNILSLLRQKNTHRQTFIQYTINNMTPSLFDEIIMSYKNNPEHTEIGIISRTILSEIKDDIYLDLLYEETLHDPELLADFVSATYYTNTQNAYNRLMSIQTLSLNNIKKNALEKGTLMMYQGNITKKILSHANTWLHQHAQMTPSQENIIIHFLLQRPYKAIQEFLNIHGSKFSPHQQKMLRKTLKQQPTRQ
jgi:hypothetical protein